MKAAILVFTLMVSAALADQPTWTFADGKTLRFDTSGETKRLVDDTGATVAELAPADDVRGAVLSEHRQCLLLLVNVERLSERRPDRRSFDYGYLLRVTSGPAGWQTTRLLEKGAPPMNQLHRRVSELGAVSDDGKTALLKYATANREIAPYTMDRVWQTWDLEARQVLGTGLKLEHGQR